MPLPESHAAYEEEDTCHMSYEEEDTCHCQRAMPYSVKRDLIPCQKRPNTVSKETYDREGATAREPCCTLKLAQILKSQHIVTFPSK